MNGWHPLLGSTIAGGRVIGVFVTRKPDARPTTHVLIIDVGGYVYLPIDDEGEPGEDVR